MFITETRLATSTSRGSAKVDIKLSTGQVNPFGWETRERERHVHANSTIDSPKCPGVVPLRTACEQSIPNKDWFSYCSHWALMYHLLFD